VRGTSKAPFAGSTKRRSSRRLATGALAALALTLLLGATLASAVAPVVTIEDAANVGFTTADVKGTVNPEGQNTTWRFQYITDAQCEENVNVNSLPCFEGAVTAHEEGTETEETLERQLTGLSPDTTYRLRLQAENADGQSEAVATNTFTTEEVTAPIVEANEAADVTYTTAKASGTVEIANEDEAFNTTFCRFEFVTQAQFEAEGFAAAEPNGQLLDCDVQPVTGSAPQPVEVKAQLANLKPGTVHHLRLVAANLGGQGGDEAPATFETDEVTAPSVSIDPVTGIGGSTAFFSGLVNPNAPGDSEDEPQDPAFDAGWHFDCVPGCGSVSGPAVAADDDPAPVSGKASGLLPNTEYTVTLHGSNLGGEDSEEASFKTDAVPPEIGSRPSVPLSASSVRLRGYVNPRNSTVTECRFAWGANGAFDQSAPCEPMPTNGNSPVEVAATITGLKANTQYSFHLIATSAAGTSQGPDRAFAPFAPPSTSPEGPLPGQGFLPHDRAWEMVSPPDKNGGDIASDTRRTRAASDGSAIGFISLVGFGDVAGTNVVTDYLSVRSGTPGTNGWATHAVTPPLKATSLQQLFANMQPLYVGEYADDLSRGVFYSPVTPLTEDPNVVNAKNLYRRADLRTPGAGTYDLLTACPLCEKTETELPAASEITRLTPMLAAATPDLERIIFETERRLTEDTPEAANRVRLFEWANGEVKLAGRIPVSPAVSCDDVAGPPCVASDSSLAGQGAGIPSGNTGASHVPYLTPHTISDGSDGHSHVFFTWPTNSSGTATQTSSSEGKLYVRTDGHETAQMNVSERTILDEFQPARFWDAAADGTRAFFTSGQALTENAQPGVTNLYMYDVNSVNDETQRLTVSASAGTYKLSFGLDTTADIAFDATAAQLEAALEALPSINAGGGSVTVSGGPGDEAGSNPYAIVFSGGPLEETDQPLITIAPGTTPLSGGAGAEVVPWSRGGGRLTLLNVDEQPEDGNDFRTLIGSSEDGSYAYFLSGGQLIEGGPPIDNGIYAWHEGTLALAGSMPNRNPLNNEQATSGSNYVLFTGNRHARVTPDGRHLLFSAINGSGLTGYDHGSCSIVFPGEGCREYYVYDAEADELQCASCNPSGAAATVDAQNVIWKNQGGARSDRHQVKTLSDDGRYAFFSSAERLVAEDRNGVSDAYVYDTETGKPHLLSSGEDAAPSWFMDASADGTDAFFTTRERLSGWDVDGAYDVYDARVNGGFPEPSPPPPACVGDACQPAPSSLNDSTPASAGFAGAGDPKANRNRKARCPQGKRRVRTRKGKSRCVKRKSAKKQSKRNRAADNDRRAGR
jgi:hypothetical protein